MKRNVLLLLIAAAAFAGCRLDNSSVDGGEYVDCMDCNGANVIEYSMPNGNDLKLETAHHVIEIQAQPGKQYDYYVWTGEKSYDADPDLVVQDGVASVLVSE